jgi:hypothetical protein
MEYFTCNSFEMEYFTDHLQESVFVFKILHVEGEGVPFQCSVETHSGNHVRLPNAKAFPEPSKPARNYTSDSNSGKPTGLLSSSRVVVQFDFHRA